jgi:lysophospholipase L1-like esterase
MLDTIRAAHPGVPVFCVTPIYSLKEGNEPAYRQRSEDLRGLMRQAANDRRQAGDKLMFVVEGLELFGEADQDAFHDPTHPNDEGNQRMAERLAPMVKKAVFGDDGPALAPGRTNSESAAPANGQPAKR